MLSYWEQQSFIHYDHIIVGGGIVGLSTAIELRERFPNTRILVLERGLLPTGASTRNAGFACMGSVTELLDDLEIMSEAEVCQLFESRKKGLEKLRKRLGDATIGYQASGSYELISEEEIEAIEKIDYLNQLLFPITQRAAFKRADEKISHFGFSQKHVKGLIENTCEGAIHTGKMMRALTDFALHSGIEIKTGAEVQRFEEQKDKVIVEIGNEFSKEHLTLQSKAIILCTNAFTNILLPNEDIKPGRGQVLITKPIAGLKWKGIYHFDKGYYYFREIDGRILIGGGRNLDFDGEATTNFELNNIIQNELENKLSEMIIPDLSFEVDLRWTGIMAFGTTKQPIVKAFSDKVFGAFRLGGMGVALGSEVAGLVANMVSERCN